jgi:hypothetical protein
MTLKKGSRIGDGGPRRDQEDWGQNNVVSVALEAGDLCI